MSRGIGIFRRDETRFGRGCKKTTFHVSAQENKLEELKRKIESLFDGSYSFECKPLEFDKDGNLRNKEYLFKGDVNGEHYEVSFKSFKLPAPYERCFIHHASVTCSSRCVDRFSQLIEREFWVYEVEAFSTFD